MPVCIKCFALKPVEEFQTKRVCIGCFKAREYPYNAYRKEFQTQRYKNFTPDQKVHRVLSPRVRKTAREHFLKEQGNVCKICLREVKLVVDHCHNTNEVRGLLCVRCNAGLGQLGDTIEGLERALKYLKGEL